MDWQRRYCDKVTSAADAVRLIRPGRRILIGSGAAEPNLLVQALVNDGAHLADNDIVHLLTLGPAPYVQPGLERRFRHTAFFIGPNVREAVQAGRADFMPVFLSEIPGLIRSRRVRIDVALIQVSPPDRYGYVSLGVSVDVVRAAVDSADLLIAAVNPNMPRTFGDSFIHVSALHALVPSDEALPELTPPAPDEVSRAIGRHVATLIPDGATLQTGIGRIPHAVLDALSSHSDLGVHTEMLSDSVIDLCEAGVINGKKKTLLKGKLVTSFVMGTRRLYDWVNENPSVELQPSDFTNDPLQIAKNDAMISINSALAVDLTGQVASDTVSGRFFSGIGGQVDFVRGAARSRGGKPIIALPSTAKDGQVSRIRSVLEEGAGVVTSRGDVHYVVTEYGVAELWGRSVRERATALIDIAHPDFRGALLDEAKQRHFVFSDQIGRAVACPWAEQRVVTLRDGEKMLIRPLRISDEEELQDLFYRLSRESVYKRFMAYKQSHPHAEMQKLVDLDYDSSMAVVACPATDPGTIVGMGRYDVDPSTRLAEIAFVVRDEWHNKGIGRALLDRLAEIAQHKGLQGFTATTLASNVPMLRVFTGSGYRMQSELVAGTYAIKLEFPPGKSQPTAPGE
jgi:acyl-CoA hydrolase/RimJ/RimL family protein N-acetyltransferase